ncbi:Spc97/Spc98 family protein [Apiospora saccharicola]
MSDEDAADVFAIPDFWRASHWVDLSQNSDSEFFASGVQPQVFPNWAREGLEPAQFTSDEFFSIPSALEALPDFTGREHNNPDDAYLEEEDYEKDSLSNVDFFSDAWVETREFALPRPAFKTWDGFAPTEIPPLEPLFLSEAGPATYDAALKTANDPLQMGNGTSNLVETNPYAASLLALALGRASIFFSWDEQKSSFIPDLDKIRVSGYSVQVLGGLQEQCLQCANISRYFSMFVQITFRTHPSPARVALAKAIDGLLLAIQAKLGIHARNIQSLLQLQSLVQPVHSLLTYFKSLLSRLNKTRKDEHLLSRLFEETQALEYGDDLLGEIMREILSRVTEPWTDFAQKWIGIKPEGGNPITKNGPGKSFVKVENISFVDDFGQMNESSDYVLDDDRMPAFVPPEVGRKLFETGRTLRLLRTHHPDHPLCSAEPVQSIKVPELQWHYDWKSIQALQEDVQAYESSLVKVIRSGGKATLLLGFLLPTSETDHLSHLLHERLFDAARVPEGSGVALSPHWSLLPLLSFGPLVEAQARLINREYMSLLFKSHNLREHIHLQKEFHLLGNGLFCSRLSHALFDPNLETAERQAGVARGGGVMGLRLGGRDNWPPASSELRLALMGLLSESYWSRPNPGPKAREGHEMPGDLSFAVRDLSEEEIEKCMNPDSLEALDFLRLSYKPPAPLAPIFTPVILLKYDRIFKLLLRVLRLLYITSELFRDTNLRTLQRDGTTNASLRFRIEAQHLVASVVAYFFDTGINLRWKSFQEWLSQVERNLRDRNAGHIISPEELREHHEEVLDEIMHTLFLRKRQQPVLKLLEDIFALILTFAKRAHQLASGKARKQADEPTDVQLYNTFKKKVDVFVTVCRGMTEKGGAAAIPTKIGPTMDEGKGQAKEENTVDQLLLQLEMSDFSHHHLGNPQAVTMSLPGPSRNLTLTEELEKLEQSITLTLQEIDHNFSKAHRIVTSSILPLVEQYGEHSKNVWEASKFWKQFFEASANVSLSGYEELANEGDTTTAEETTRLADTTTATSDGGYADPTSQSVVADDQSTYHGQQQQQHSHHHREMEDSLLDDGTLEGSTPRPPATKSQMQFANFGSPYENLRRELKGEEDQQGGDHTAGSDIFAEDPDETTQQLQQDRLPDMSMTPHDDSSLMLDAPTPMQGGTRTNLFGTANKDKNNKDPLLHRLLDKNYRIQATPHKGGQRSGFTPNKAGAAGGAGAPEADHTRRALWQDSPQSSPEMAAPTLRTNLYSAMSPLKGQRGRPAAGAGPSGEAPRTPGVSVQTPAKKRDVFAEYRSGGGDSTGKGKGLAKYDNDEITWDSDDEDDGMFGGMSPPKTIQFALPPSKLLQTPAREASKRIVEDILLTAGAAPEYGSTPEHSPTMVQMNHDILDDTF